MLLLKTVCFSLWLGMMLLLTLTKQMNRDPAAMITLRLDDCERAERQIYAALRQLLPGERLSLEISLQNPAHAELYGIASRLGRKYPVIMVQVIAPPLACLGNI